MCPTLLQQFMWSDAPEPRRLREIDYHFQMHTIAESARQASQYMAEFRERNIEMCRRQAESDARLGTLVDLSRDQLDEQRAANLLLEESNEIGAAQVRVLCRINEQLESIGQQLATSNAQLQRLCEMTSARFATETREVCSTGLKMLRRAFASAEPDRSESFEDAYRAFTAVTQNPVGANDAVTWLHLGWLELYHSHNAAKSIESLRRARRLSDGESPECHFLAARFLAAAMYRAQLYGDAYAAGAYALTKRDGGELHVECARYAFLAGKEPQAREHIERAVEYDWTLLATLATEPDFGTPSKFIAEVQRALTAQARDSLRQSLQHLLEFARGIDARRVALELTTERTLQNTEDFAIPLLARAEHASYVFARAKAVEARNRAHEAAAGIRVHLDECEASLASIVAYSESRLAREKAALASEIAAAERGRDIRLADCRKPGRLWAFLKSGFPTREEVLADHDASIASINERRGPEIGRLATRLHEESQRLAQLRDFRAFIQDNAP